MKAKMEPKPKLTSAAGIAVGDNQNSLAAAGPRGPALLSAWRLFIVPATKPNLTPEYSYNP